MCSRLEDGSRCMQTGPKPTIPSPLIHRLPPSLTPSLHHLYHFNTRFHAAHSTTAPIHPATTLTAWVKPKRL